MIGPTWILLFFFNILPDERLNDGVTNEPIRAERETTLLCLGKRSVKIRVPSYSFLAAFRKLRYFTISTGKVSTVSDVETEPSIHPDLLLTLSDVKPHLLKYKPYFLK